MKKILISEEANNEITTLLEDVIINCKDNDNIQAIYLKEYSIGTSQIPVIELEMIANDFDFPIKDIQTKYKNQIKTILQKYGIQVMINYVPESLLTFFPDLDFESMDFIEIVLHHTKCMDFINGRIVLDKIGTYHALQEKMISAYTGEKKTNQVEFVPPIELKRLK